MQDMWTLVMDCSFYGLTLGLAQDKKMVDSHMTDVARSSGEMHPQLEAMLGRQGIVLADVKQLVLTLGPGSFTGIRLGLAFAEALKVAKPEVKVWGLSTLQAVAMSYGKGPVEVWLDAAGGQVFVQRFDEKLEHIDKMACLTLEEAVAQRDAAYALVTGMGVSPVVLADAVLGHVTAEALLALMGRGLPEDLVPMYVKQLEYRRAGA